MNDFIFERCQLDNVVQIIPKMIGEKEIFIKSYEKSVYLENGIEFIPSEEYRIKEGESIFRGIHFQAHSPQKRLITVISGAAYLTVVNLGKNSPQLGQYEMFLLEGKHPKYVFVPEWYGVATISLKRNTIISVMSEGRYYGQYSSGICFNDDTLGIEWPVQGFKVSEKDRALMTFKEYLEKNI